MRSQFNKNSWKEFSLDQKNKGAAIEKLLFVVQGWLEMDACISCPSSFEGVFPLSFGQNKIPVPFITFHHLAVEQGPGYSLSF